MGSTKGAPHDRRSKFVQLPNLPEAACVGIPTDMFISEDGEQGEIHFNTHPAKRVCKRCPEIEPCLEYALKFPLLTGVWGGTTPKEREAIRAERAVS